MVRVLPRPVCERIAAMLRMVLAMGTAYAACALGGADASRNGFSNFRPVKVVLSSVAIIIS